MSAVTWSEVAAPQAPRGPQRGPGRRGHLSLVPPPRPAAQGAMHLTRRGRLALTVSVLAVILMVAAALGAFSGSPASSGVLGGGATGSALTVQSGQTLSEIAEIALPQLSTGNAITAIQVANNLSTTAISAGQTLVIPSP